MISWDCALHGELTLSAVRLNHQPAASFRISPNSYAKGTAIPGGRRAGRLYVLRGSCSYRAGDVEWHLHAPAYLDPSGEYFFRAQTDVDIVNVWDLSRLMGACVEPALRFQPTMQRLSCHASAESAEDPSAHVSEPQFLMLWTSATEATVTVYFMENLAYSIIDPHAVYSGPDVSLRYSIESPGAVAAGMSLRKIVYRFRGLTQRKYTFTLQRVKSAHERRAP